MNQMTPFLGWTEEAKLTLAHLWRDKFSASQIAARLGVTRNAVIGMSRRLRLNGEMDRLLSGETSPAKSDETGFHDRVRRTVRTPEIDETIIAARRIGKSYREISYALGFDRRTIAGIARRLANEGRIDEAKVRRGPRPTQARRASMTSGLGAPLTDFTLPEADDCTPLMVTLVELGPLSCRWPIGDPCKDDFRYCGANTRGRGSYCTSHAQMSRGDGMRCERLAPAALKRLASAGL